MPNAFIRKLAAHGPLSNEDIRLLSEATRFSRSVNSRRDLIREGDEPGSLFIVLRGWVCRYISYTGGLL
jgi:CRP-like cAMP-binding protein